MKILIIEDNEHNLYLARYLLEARGHEITDARAGPEGIAAANKSPPELILLDIELPQMDGYTVARVLRENPRLDTVPIAAVTSYAMNGDRVKALESGCDAYIEKPIDPDSFATVVEAILAAGRRRQGDKT